MVQFCLVDDEPNQQTPQSEERTRGKDRRSAKTGVRAVGGRAPSATVQGEQVDSGPDPMTYALEQVNCGFNVVGVLGQDVCTLRGERDRVV